MTRSTVHARRPLLQRVRWPATIVLASAVGFGAAAAGDELISPFRDEAIMRGAIYLVEQGEPEPGSFGCGVLLADLDGDRDLDLLFVGSDDGRPALYRNDGTGHFEDVGNQSGLPPILHASGLTAADYDGDGDLDLHVTRWLAPDRLYRNDGDLRFTDVTAASGLNVPVCAGAGAGAAWSDYDRDGDLDLALANRTLTQGNPARNALFRNDAGVFVDVAPALGLDDDQQTFQCLWVDVDDDGDQDLYLSTDKGEGGTVFRNRLFSNDGDGTFTETTEESGAGVYMDSMGVAVGDVDGNGALDFYIANTAGGGNRLLLNDGTGKFVDGTLEAGVVSNALCWGTQFLDFDNDADLDLYVCNSLTVPNRLYRQSDQWPLVDVALPAGCFAIGDSYCMAIGDVDDDGDLDLVVQQYDALAHLYVNYEGERRNHCRVRLEGVGWNRHAIGARLTGTIGETLLVREIAAGSNYKSMNELVQHFGLGDASQLDTLDVRWPDGATRSFVDLPAGSTWTLAHPDLLGDSNDDGVFDADDLSAVQSRWNTTVAAGDERFDFNGDFSIDASDGDALLAAWDGPLEDCDGDGAFDVLQIVGDPSLDLDGDARIDDCPTDPCDLDGDGAISGSDLLILLSSWGPCPAPCVADLDGDGFVSGPDLTDLLSRWGSCD